MVIDIGKILWGDVDQLGLSGLQVEVDLPGCLHFHDRSLTTSWLLLGWFKSLVGNPLV